MTKDASHLATMEPKIGSLKLRLNLSAAPPKQPSANQQISKTQPAEVTAEHDHFEEFRPEKRHKVVKNKGDSVTSRSGETPPRPLRLTVRLKESCALSEPSDFIPREAERTTAPKLVLQLGKVTSSVTGHTRNPGPSTKPETTTTGGEIDVEGGEIAIKEPSEFKKAPPKRRRRSRSSSLAAKMPSQESSVAGIAPLPSYRMPYIVPPSSQFSRGSTTPSNTQNMTPAEREEEILTRRSLVDTFDKLWSKLVRPNLAKVGLDDVPKTALPYWILLAPIESATHAPNVKSNLTIANPEVDREIVLQEELEKLKGRLEARAATERTKEVPTELLLLEQRLCLEEEKFLFSKLKSEYNLKVNEYIAKKKAVEGLPPNVVPFAIPQIISPQSSVATSNSLATSGNLSHQAQAKILPRFTPAIIATMPLQLQQYLRQQQEIYRQQLVQQYEAQSRSETKNNTE